MEKIKVFILKSPVLMAFIAFLLGLIFSYIFHMKEMHSVKIIAFTSVAFIILYSYNFNEQVPRMYRIKYALIITLLNCLFTFFTFVDSSMPIAYDIVIAAILSFLITYFFAGVVTKSYSNENKTFPPD